MTGAAIAQAFAMVFEPGTIVAMLLASLFGLFVGAVPGLTATMATALLVPVTFYLSPIAAVATIITASAMAIFSGDIPGCLLRIPGTPASAAYTDEAYAMTRKGQAEMALGAGLWLSRPATAEPGDADGEKLGAGEGHGRSAGRFVPRPRRESA